MDPALRRAWTEIVTAEDYELHMAAIGQAQAAAELTGLMVRAAALSEGARVVIAGAGTGQMFDYLDSMVLRPYRLTCADLNPRYLERLDQRLKRCGLTATLLEDDIEQTAIEPAPDLLLATLLLEHIEWRRGVEALAGLRPGVCAIVLQENPEGMSSAVTPGRVVPPSLARAMETAHAVLVPRGGLVDAFGARGYVCRDTFSRDVADGKRLVGLMFTWEAGPTE
jgi:hypothetical protein